MKVYLTYEKDGYNGQKVEKVFSSKTAARDWIIESRFALHRELVGEERHELEEQALEYVEEHELSSDPQSQVDTIAIQLNYDVDSAQKCMDMLILVDLGDDGDPILCAGYKGNDDIWRYYPCEDPNDEISNVVGNVIAWSKKPELTDDLED